ncbi:MAG: Doubled motif (Paired 1) [Armatimonadetes bacterium]|nr:Doubled motif (Paired 1) [Armatimonadota bacterium]
MSSAVQGARRRRLFILLFPLVSLFLLLGGLWHLATQPQPVHLVEDHWEKDPGRYAGTPACRECHAQLVEDQSASNHARTVRSLAKEPPQAPFGNGQEVVDPSNGARYGTTGGKEPQLTLTAGGLSASQPLHWEFGAGNHAFGYLGQTETGDWIDARLNFYPQLGKWDFTSSQDKPQKYLLEQPMGRPRTPDEVFRCFACHATVVRADGVKGTGPLEPAKLTIRPDRSELNVSCESCHGPRAAHVQEFRTRKPVSPKQDWSAGKMNRVCGRCHGLDNIEVDHPVAARFQPWGLEQSRCFQASGGKLTCSSCHNPHGNASRDAVFYEQKCLGCHSGSAESVGKTVCPKGRKTGCVGCHMPADSKSMLHVTFTDHFIRIVKKAGG